MIFDDAESVNETAVSAVGGTVTGGESVDVVPALFARVSTEAIPRLQSHPDVRRIEYDTPVETPPVEGDRTVEITASDATQDGAGSEVVPWGIDRIRSREANERVGNATESNVTVAVLDTGIDYDHEDLAGSVTWGVDVTGGVEYGKAEADDVEGHGTHVAGTIAARQNAVGVVGTDPNVELYAIRVLDRDGGSVSDVIEGIDQALKGPDGVVGTEDDADVISMSLGSQSGTVALREAIERATDRSVPVVVAAGNDGDGDGDTDNVSYPARYDDTIAVAATDFDDRVPEFSSEGPAIDLAAPGVGTLSTYPNDRYTRLSGTSMATGHVSGTVAMIIAEDLRDGKRDYEPDDIETQLEVTARDIDRSGTDRVSGAGLVDARAAVDVASLQPRIVVSNPEILTGEQVEVYVVRSETRQRIPASVRIADAEYAVDRNSAARYTFTSSGTYSITATVSAESGYEYTVTDSVTVRLGNVVGNGQPAGDIDNDGRYEDVNGDGNANVVDAQALFVRLDGPIVRNNTKAFDFNGDGGVDILDVQALYRESRRIPAPSGAG